jgi:hypothetical protein
MFLNQIMNSDIIQMTAITNVIAIVSGANTTQSLHIQLAVVRLPTQLYIVSLSPVSIMKYTPNRLMTYTKKIAKQIINPVDSIVLLY